MIRSTGELLVQAEGMVTGLTEFIPEKPEGTVEIIFTVDTEVLQGQELVVFERLYEGSISIEDTASAIPIAKHEDLNDTEQTITVPVKPKPIPDTGDTSNISLWGALCIMSMVLLLQLNGKRKRR